MYQRINWKAAVVPEAAKQRWQQQKRRNGRRRRRRGKTIVEMVEECSEIVMLPDTSRRATTTTSGTKVQYNNSRINASEWIAWPVVKQTRCLERVGGRARRRTGRAASRRVNGSRAARQAVAASRCRRLGGWIRTGHRGAIANIGQERSGTAAAAAAAARGCECAY